MRLPRKWVPGRFFGGRRARTFGTPFYADWRLTDDELPAPEGLWAASRIEVEDLVHASLAEYPRYRDPETYKRCEPERLMEWMALERGMRQRWPKTVHTVGFPRWKKPIVPALFSGSTVCFASRTSEVPSGETALLWGVKPAPATPVVRIEDGFLRSVGPGADLVQPLSWVTDRTGMYYDATRPSGLERLLVEIRFDATLVERARRLRKRIADLGIRKYNVDAGQWQRPPGTARVVLVPGQVETDAPITLGAPELCRNLDLLRVARQAVPDAWPLYKPPPDIVAKLRRRGAGEDRAGDCCYEVVTDVQIDALLGSVDEVHVQTSLAGFEALLRRRRLATCGCPFCAGWGLTEDHEAMPRRSRRLSLSELVAAVLILYPNYLSRTTGHFTTPEHALAELAECRARCSE